MAHLSSPVNSKSLDTVIFWFRRDLRVEDNPGLLSALHIGRRLIPVFIWSPEQEGEFYPGTCSRWWLSRSLRCLEQRLAKLGSKLVLKRAPDALTGLRQVIAETGAKTVFFSQLYDPISLVADYGVKQDLAKDGVTCWSYCGDVFYEPWEMLDEDGQPFTTFEDFWNCVCSSTKPVQFPLPPPQFMPPVPHNVTSLHLKDLHLLSTEEMLTAQSHEQRWTPGPSSALQCLENFLKTGLPVFSHDKAKVGGDSTSQLSPFIHYGEISIRYIYYRVKQQLCNGTCSKDSCADFLKQTGYREYSRYISFHFPFTHERALMQHLNACPWKYDQKWFKCWKQGLTGYPLVDAGMRQLWSEGWVHNRLRVVCASFLVKNLLLPWQWGLKHYWNVLVDADLECDALGWQYVSGCLADAHPFSSMMDLEKESQRFDADGRYIRRYLPSLARIPNDYIHCPWKAPPAVLEEAGVELGINYPHRIILPEESADLVENACAVIHGMSNQTHAGAREPYRPPTLPLDPRNFVGVDDGRNPPYMYGSGSDESDMESQESTDVAATDDMSMLRAVDAADATSWNMASLASLKTQGSFI